MKIFWSWQSDRERKVCQYFVRDALEEAAILLAEEFKIEERLTVDSDTKGVPGSPDIASTIFEKIASADLYIADMTPVAQTSAGKHVPNPNVMIELGYAERALSSQRIITVANEHWYEGPETLPFNRRHKRGPITYKLGPSKKSAEIKAARQQLANKFLEPIRLILGADKEIDEPPAIRPSRENDPSIWFPVGTKLKHNDWFGEGSPVEVGTIEGPRAYMRVIATGWSDGIPQRSILSKIPDEVAMWPLGRWRNGDGGSNEGGLLRYKLIMHNGGRSTDTAAQLFRDPPEIWGWDSSLADTDGGVSYLPINVVAKNWSSFLGRSIRLLDFLGAKRPITVEAGVTGLHSLHWPNGSVGLDNQICISKQASDWSEEDQFQFVVDAMAKLADAYSLEAFSSEIVRNMTV